MKPETLLKLLTKLGRLLASSTVIQDQDGQSLPDYLLLAGLIALACLAVATRMGLGLSGLYGF
jgi:hypothetical protein